MPLAKTRNLIAHNPINLREEGDAGMAFIENLELEAAYKIKGLTQLWSFSDGSCFELEPSGGGRYVKANSLDSGNQRFLYSNYNCRAK